MTPAPLLRRLARFRTPFASASASASASAIPYLPPVQLSLPLCTQAAPSAAVSASGTSPPSVFRAVNHGQVTRARASLEIPASKSQRPTLIWQVCGHFVGPTLQPPGFAGSQTLTGMTKLLTLTLTFALALAGCAGGQGLPPAAGSPSLGRRCATVRVVRVRSQACSGRRRRVAAGCMRVRCLNKRTLQAFWPVRAIFRTRKD